MMLDDMAQYLRYYGMENIYLGALPDKPDKCMALFEYQGIPPNQIAGIEAPGLQVVARAQNDYDWCQRKLKEAHDALKLIGFEDGEAANGVEINGSFYFRVEAAHSGVMPQGVDDNGCVRLGRNYYIYMEDK